MSKSSFILGAMVSVGVHVVVFMPELITGAGHEEPLPPTPGRLTMPMDASFNSSMPAASELSPKQTREDAPVLEEVAQARSHDQSTAAGSTAASEDNENDLPALRIVWDGPDQARAVAASLGCRFVAVNNAGEVLGQISLQGPPRLDVCDENLTRFSNRVRTLPKTFFGRNMARGADRSVQAIWLLVPAALDREFAAIQRHAIVARGLAPQAVRHTEARFVKKSGGSYGLHIEHVQPR